jgi:hypothetical protein
MPWFEVLSLDEVASSNIECGFPESIAVNIFRLDGGHIASIAWNFRYRLALVEGLEFFVYLSGDVSE